jgi:Uma2 family endonuclease
MGEAGIFAPDDRVELIQGEIIDMSPIGSGHAGLVKHLIRLFTRALEDSIIVAVQDPVRLNDFSEPQPDLALLQYREDFYTKSHPRAEDVLLLVEVADTTLQYDTEIKLPLYARSGIPEVWLVDVEGREVVLYSHPEEGRYAMHQNPDDLKCVKATALKGISFDLSEIFER